MGGKEKEKRGERGEGYDMYVKIMHREIIFQVEGWYKLVVKGWRRFETSRQDVYQTRQTKRKNTDIRVNIKSLKLTFCANHNENHAGTLVTGIFRGKIKKLCVFPQTTAHRLSLYHMLRTKSERIEVDQSWETFDNLSVSHILNKIYCLQVTNWNYQWKVTQCLRISIIEYSDSHWYKVVISDL